MEIEKAPIAFCPVPLEQQPIYEYEQLKDACFFHWATLEPPEFRQKLLGVWLWSWLMTGPIAAGSFAPDKFPLTFALAGTLGGGLMVSLLVLRLYLGWLYVHSRLAQEQVVYEESGWYDGQIWQKPEAIIRRDRLIITYQVDPILKRMKRTMTLLALMLLIDLTGLVWSRI